MCRNCNRCGYYDNWCGNRYFNRGCCDNRCDDLLFPLIFWILRDRQRGCRCNFVDRYDRFRC